MAPERVAPGSVSAPAPASELSISGEVGMAEAIARVATAVGQEDNPGRSGGASHQRPQTVLMLQRTVGNAAVQRFLRNGSPSPVIDRPPLTNASDLATACPVSPVARARRVPVPADPSPLGALIVQRSTPEQNTEQIALVTKALETRKPGDVKDIKDVNRADKRQKLELIRILAYQGWVGPDDESKIEQIWGSFGHELPQVASTATLLWNHCVEVGAELEELPPVKTLKDRFPSDIKELVSGYLFDNRQFVIKEMDRLGLPADEKAAAPAPTADQADEIQKIQEGAAGVAKLQKAQEAARGIYVGYQKEIDSTAPAGQPRVDYVPVTFNPFAKPEFESLPSSLITYEVETKPYQDVKTDYDKATDTIGGLLKLHPTLYAVSREGQSSTTASFAGIASPAQARQQLASAMQKLFRDIETTQKQLDDGKLDPLDLTPVHARLRGGMKAPSGTNWSGFLPNWVANDLVKDHELANALTTLGLEAASMALFALAPFTGGASLYVMLAGLAATGVKAKMSAEHYETLALAAKTSATPGTELVEPQQVEHAKMVAEADKIALALAVLAVGAAAAGKLIGQIRNPAKSFVNNIERNPKSVAGRSADDIAKQFNDAGFKATIEQSTKKGTSGKAVQVRIAGHPEITNIQVHPGGGRHTAEGVSYWKISTNTQGKIWVIPKTFKGAAELGGSLVYYD